MLVAMLLFMSMDAIASWSSRTFRQSDCRGAQLDDSVAVAGGTGVVAKSKHTHGQTHEWQSCINLSAPFLFFTALDQLPLADATVVFFSSAFLIAGSALFLKERIGRHRWSAVVFGFVGVVIAMNPTGEGDCSPPTVGATIMWFSIYLG